MSDMKLDVLMTEDVDSRFPSPLTGEEKWTVLKTQLWSIFYHV
jgi:hypothetical protein